MNHILVDYHLHTNHSFDGIQTMTELCEAAIARSIDEIAITEHMDIYKGKPYDYNLDCPATFEEVHQMQNRYKDKLTIRCGIELGQPMRNPQEAKKFLADWSLDFIIGSIHNMEKDIDVGEYNFKSLDWNVFFTQYLDWIYDFAKNYDYDVLGHVTYPLRYLCLQTGQNPSLLLWTEQFAEIFRVVIARGKGIELNTSSIARGKGMLMPTEELLALYKDMGGTIITIGSDAHVKEQTGVTALDGKNILLKNGFSQFSTYEKRQPIMHII